MAAEKTRQHSLDQIRDMPREKALSILQKVNGMNFSEAIRTWTNANGKKNFVERARKGKRIYKTFGMPK
ncbi:MAG TPA: hypothetical protein VJ179_01145 [Patescibacteria group bacterium]|nr:hypothetical protein [Patescibacteria group bacterium]